MSVIMITLPGDALGAQGVFDDILERYRECFEYQDWRIDLDPSVYVVRPDDSSENVAVFTREEDAEEFRETFEHVGDVERVPIADQATAAQMVAERSDDHEIEEEAKERATCSHCLARTYRGEECVCDPDEGDAEDYDEALAELRAMQDPLYGVFWAGDTEEVQRDDESDRFPGDMEAAIHVARTTGCHWLLYVEDGERWRVLACSSEAYASEVVADWTEHDDDGYAFCFDGRRGLEALVDGPGGIGYRLLEPGLRVSIETGGDLQPPLLPRTYEGTVTSIEDDILLLQTDLQEHPVSFTLGQHLKITARGSES